MKTETRAILAKLLYAIESRDLLSAGTCYCGRPRDRMVDATMRKWLDELSEALVSEEVVEEFGERVSRTTLLEVD